jgi:hypothetical protein
LTQEAASVVSAGGESDERRKGQRLANQFYAINPSARENGGQAQPGWVKAGRNLK